MRGGGDSQFRRDAAGGDARRAGFYQKTENREACVLRERGQSCYGDLRLHISKNLEILIKSQEENLFNRNGLDSADLKKDVTFNVLLRHVVERIKQVTVFSGHCGAMVGYPLQFFQQLGRTRKPGR